MTSTLRVNIRSCSHFHPPHISSSTPTYLHPPPHIFIHPHTSSSTPHTFIHPTHLHPPCPTPTKNIHHISNLHKKRSSYKQPSQKHSSHIQTLIKTFIPHANHHKKHSPCKQTLTQTFSIEVTFTKTFIIQANPYKNIHTSTLTKKLYKQTLKQHSPYKVTFRKVLFQ